MNIFVRMYIDHWVVNIHSDKNVYLLTYYIYTNNKLRKIFKNFDKKPLVQPGGCTSAEILFFKINHFFISYWLLTIFYLCLSY